MASKITIRELSILETKAKYKNVRSNNVFHRKSLGRVREGRRGGGTNEEWWSVMSISLDEKMKTLANFVQENFQRSIISIYSFGNTIAITTTVLGIGFFIHPLYFLLKRNWHLRSSIKEKKSIIFKLSLLAKSKMKPLLLDSIMPHMSCVRITSLQNLVI